MTGSTKWREWFRAVRSGAAGAAWAAPLFWALTPFDYERAGGFTRTLLRCTGSVELLCLSSETSSRSISGLPDETRHTPFCLRARGLTLAIFRPPHPPCPSYGPVVDRVMQGHGRQLLDLFISSPLVTVDDGPWSEMSLDDG